MRWTARCCRSESLPKQRELLVFASVVVILACSLGIYFAVVSLVQESLDTAQSALALQVSGDVIKSFSGFLSFTQNVAAGFERPDELLSERQFEDIASVVLAPFAASFVLTWTPRVRHEDRAEYELEERRRLNGTNRTFTVKEYWVIKDRPRVVNGRVVVAPRPNMSVYYPLRYLAEKKNLRGETDAVIADVINLDMLAFEPARRNALLKATSSLETVISASVDFVLLGQLGGSIVTATKSGTGAVWLGFLYRDLLEHILNTVQREVHSFLRILDTTPGEKKVELISGELTSEGVGNTRQSQSRTVPSQYKDHAVTHQHEFGGRRYLFEFYFVANYAAFASSTAIAAGVSVCVILSSAFLGYIVRVQHLRNLQAVELAKIETSKKTQDRLVNYVCHEMRNPVHVIKFCSERLEQHGLQDEILQILRVNAGQLGSLVDGWLDISKSLHVPLALSLTTVDVVGLVKDCFLEFQLVYTELKPSVTWKLEIGGSLNSLYVNVDKLRLRQVIVNGLTNAIKYTDAGEITVRIGTEVLSSQVQIPQATSSLSHVKGCQVVNDFDGVSERMRILVDIEDSGKGLQDSEAKTLFYEFKQGSAQNTDIPSTGLGLSIARHLARLMEGDVTLRNRSSGHGAIFSLSVIADKVGTDCAELKDGCDGIEEQCESKDKCDVSRLFCTRVYVCDDDFIQLSLLKRMLSEFNNVHYSSGVDETLKNLSDTVAGQSEPSVILTDINLGILTGFDLLKAVRERGITAPVIACTAEPSALNDTERYKQAGFVGVITKPYSKSSLLRCISEAVQSCL